jgi:hypothetical protein
MKGIIACLLLSAVFSGTAQAADVLGHGTVSCGEWTAEHRHEAVATVAENAWLSGYLSAYAAYEDDQLSLPDVGGREGWISNYCRNHPLDLIYVAADQLILELKRQAQR